MLHIFRIPRLDVVICRFFTSFHKVQIFFYLLEKIHVPLKIKGEGSRCPNLGQLFSWVWGFLWPSDLSLWPESAVSGLVMEAFVLRRDSGPSGIRLTEMKLQSWEGSSHYLLMFNSVIFSFAKWLSFWPLTSNEILKHMKLLFYRLNPVEWWQFYIIQSHISLLEGYCSI